MADGVVLDHRDEYGEAELLPTSIRSYNLNQGDLLVNSLAMLSAPSAAIFLGHTSLNFISSLIFSCKASYLHQVQGSSKQQLACSPMISRISSKGFAENTKNANLYTKCKLPKMYSQVK